MAARGIFERTQRKAAVPLDQIRCFNPPDRRSMTVWLLAVTPGSPQVQHWLGGHKTAIEMRGEPLGMQADAFSRIALLVSWRSTTWVVIQGKQTTLNSCISRSALGWILISAWAIRTAGCGREPPLALCIGPGCQSHSDATSFDITSFHITCPCLFRDLSYSPLGLTDICTCVRTQY